MLWTRGEESRAWPEPAGLRAGGEDQMGRRVLVEQADLGGLGVPEEALPGPWGLPLHIGGTWYPSWGLLTSEHPAAAIAFL